MARSKRKPVQDQTAKLLEEGGMLDEGGTVDPESGNEVPTGSLQEEVRDDIPAQLSEGEFVFPADVVRFIGLERLMQMRQAAKRGLAQMNEMGQMGNADEATMDDGEDTEFETEIDDILEEVEAEAAGGKMPEGMR
jgi:Arc/MetJ-type ribon-helix-helix transcriptional regulator